MTSLIDEMEMLDVLREFVREAGTQRAAAARLGVSGMFVSDMLRGYKPISEAVAEKLGYRRSWRYELVNGGRTGNDDNLEA